MLADVRSKRLPFFERSHSSRSATPGRVTTSFAGFAERSAGVSIIFPPRSALPSSESSARACTTQRRHREIVGIVHAERSPLGDSSDP